MDLFAFFTSFFWCAGKENVEKRELRKYRTVIKNVVVISNKIEYNDTYNN